MRFQRTSAYLFTLTVLFTLLVATPASALLALGPEAHDDPVPYSTMQRVLPTSTRGSYAGAEVAVDGHTAVVVARPLFIPERSGTIHAYVLGSNGMWSRQATLVSTAGAFDALGCSAAISGDVAVIGASEDDSFGERSGAAYVFTRSGSTWTQAAKLVSSAPAAGAQFGHAVAISGNTIVVGEPAIGQRPGTVHVFTGTGPSWSVQATFTPPAVTAEDRFPEALAIDGDTVIAGGWYANTAGSAWVYRRFGTAWSQEATLTGSDTAQGDAFGFSVAVDGTTAVVGAPWNDTGGDDAGAAYVFSNVGWSWSETAKLTALDAQRGDWLGHDVDVSGDTVIASAHGDNDKGVDAGAVYLYRARGLAWEQVSKLKSADRVSWYGYSVGVDDGHAVTGAPLDADRADFAGSVWFARPRYRVASGSTLSVSAPGLLGNDFSIMGPLSSALHVAPAHGTATVGADGRFTYRPAAGFRGMDRFSYVASNTLGVSNPATVTIDVKRNTAISLTTGSRTLTEYGDYFRVAGYLRAGRRGLAGKRVFLQYSIDGTTFENRATARTTSSSGYFAFTFKPRYKTYYRVRFFEDAENFATTSARRWANPRAYVARPHAAWRVDQGERTRVWGYFKPYHVDTEKFVRVYRYRLVEGRYRYVDYVWARLERIAGERYTVKYGTTMTFPTRGPWRMRAYHNDARHAGSWSSYEYLTVE